MEHRLPQDLVERIAAVRSVGAITGAGVSQESGIRTYRGSGGLYDDPSEGERTVEALSGPTLARNPDLTWRTLAGLAAQARDARPNRAHVALAAIERKVQRFVLLTQNVDGLHRLAGSRNLIEIHGHLFDTRCTACDRRGTLEPAELAALARAPRCVACSGTLRPDVVLFEELLPPDRYERVLREFHQDVPDLVIVAGTTALFPYITDPVWVARSAGRLTIEVNPEPTQLSPLVDFALRGPAGEWLPQLERALPA